MQYLNKGIRYDGRGLTDFRPVDIQPGYSETAEGSAKVKIGETEVIVGVKMAVEKPFMDTADEGILMVNAELLPLSSPRFEAGPPGNEAIELARVVDRGIREAKAIDVKQLCIAKGEKVWSVMIDICTLNDAGNLLDAAGIGALAALKNARFPTYDAEGNEIDYHKKTNKKLPLVKDPLPVTVYKIGDKLLVDPLPEEQEAATARLTVATVEDGTLVAMQKGGDEPLTVEEIDEMVGLAQEKAKELRAVL